MLFKLADYFIMNVLMIIFVLDGVAYMLIILERKVLRYIPFPT